MIGGTVYLMRSVGKTHDLQAGDRGSSPASGTIFPPQFTLVLIIEAARSPRNHILWVLIGKGYARRF